MEENSEMAIKTIVNITQDYMHASPSEITCVLEGKKRKADEFEEGSSSEEEAPPPSKKQKKNTVKRAFTNTMNVWFCEIFVNKFSKFFPFLKIKLRK